MANAQLDYGNDGIYCLGCGGLWSSPAIGSACESTTLCRHSRAGSTRAENRTCFVVRREGRRAQRHNQRRDRAIAPADVDMPDGEMAWNGRFGKGEIQPILPNRIAEPENFT